MTGTSGRIGVVGLGAMGLPVLRRLAAAGHSMLAYDRAEPALTAAAEIDGVEIAAGVADLAAKSGTVLTCLASPEAVEAVHDQIGATGLLVGELSTVGPTLARRLHARHESQGNAYVEAPMLGGVDEAAAGTLFLIVSGEEADVARLEPLFPLFSRGWRNVGPPGTASLFKTVQNGLGLVQMCAIAEALAMIAKAGGDARAFVEVVDAGKGMAATPLFRAKAPTMLEREAPVKGSLHIAGKDSALAAALAGELGLDLPLFRRSAELFAAAMGQGLAGADVAAVARSVEAATGVQLGQRP